MSGTYLVVAALEPILSILEKLICTKVRSYEVRVSFRNNFDPSFLNGVSVPLILRELEGSVTNTHWLLSLVDLKGRHKTKESPHGIYRRNMLLESREKRSKRIALFKHRQRLRYVEFHRQ